MTESRRPSPFGENARDEDLRFENVRSTMTDTAALAEATGVTPTVKLPNDVLIGGKKVAGILAESSNGRVRLGIGVNANQTAGELPAEADTPPTSLRLETEGPVDRARLLTTILAELERAYDTWVSETAASG